MAKNRESKGGPVSDFDRLNQMVSTGLDSVVATTVEGAPVELQQNTVVTTQERMPPQPPGNQDMIQRHQAMLQQEEALIRSRANQPLVTEKPVIPENPVKPGEDQYLSAHRAMLRQEEERLAKLPKMVDPALKYGDRALGIPREGTSTKVEDVVPCASCDPVVVEAYRMYMRLIAGGLIPPMGTAWVDLQQLLPRLKAYVEGK